jgi:predicted dehydrogenase
MKANLLLVASLLATLVGMTAMQSKGKVAGLGEIRLIVLDPGHFHASLIQKTMYDQVSPVVHVYGPDGWDLDEHLRRVEAFNTRADNPTHWRQEVYRGPDFLQKMVAEKAGNVVIIAGNNRRKAEYIKASVDAGLNVLADKPLCIDQAGWQVLQQAFETARRKNVLIYDMMTERYEITTILQNELAHNMTVFGILQAGTPDNPSIVNESVHNLIKQVAGTPLRRPAWFLDVTQQGEGLVDVTSHLVDLTMWGVFAKRKVNYKADVEIVQAKKWPTTVTKEQFSRITGLDDFPDFLKSQTQADGSLPYMCNGEIIFKLRGAFVKNAVRWNVEAPEGGGDTHFSKLRGLRSTILIKQGKEQGYRPELYVEPAAEVDSAVVGDAVRKAVAGLALIYPGLDVQEEGALLHVVIPDQYRVGHEAHFAQVTEKFMEYLRRGRMPDWEAPNMLAKYYITTKSLEIAKTELPTQTSN